VNRYAVPEFAWWLLIVAMGLFGLLSEVK